MSATPPPAAVELKFQIVRFWQSFLKSAAAASNRDVRSRPITSSSAATGRRGTSTLLARYIPSSSDTSGHAACKAESSRLVYASGSVRTSDLPGDLARFGDLVANAPVGDGHDRVITKIDGGHLDLFGRLRSTNPNHAAAAQQFRLASPRLVAQPVALMCFYWAATVDPRILRLTRSSRPRTR